MLACAASLHPQSCSLGDPTTLVAKLDTDGVVSLVCRCPFTVEHSRWLHMGHKCRNELYMNISPQISKMWVLRRLLVGCHSRALLSHLGLSQSPPEEDQPTVNRCLPPHQAGACPHQLPLQGLHPELGRWRGLNWAGTETVGGTFDGCRPTVHCFDGCQPTARCFNGC